MRILLACLLAVIAVVILSLGSMAYGTGRIDAANRRPLEGAAAERHQAGVEFHGLIEQVIAEARVHGADAQLAADVERLRGRIHSMSRARFMEIVAALSMHCHSSRHAIAVRLYGLAIEELPQHPEIAQDPKDGYELYSSAAWIARKHGEGLDESQRAEDVLKLYREGEAFCKARCPDRVTGLYFEQARFLAFCGKMEDEEAVITEGMGWIGRNDDRDGSLLHEMGMLQMRLALRGRQPARLDTAITCFDKAIVCKEASGNRITPLYSAKMRLEALTEKAFSEQDQAAIPGLLRQYGELIGRWEQQLQEIDDAGRSALPELYLSTGLLHLRNGRKDLAIRSLQQGRKLLLQAHPTNPQVVVELDRFLNRIGPVGAEDSSSH
jgi:tetratricopeptide (TPR) repeat protein